MFPFPSVTSFKMPGLPLRYRIATTHIQSSGSVERAQTMSEAIKETSKFTLPIIEHEYSVKVQGITTIKNSAKSLAFRTEGNAAFGRKQLLQSLLAYDDSISHALSNSQELALAYANRSAALHKMGKLTDCLVDIQRAVDCGYPENIKYKLLLRKGQCLRDLGQSEQALHNFDLALEAIEMSELPAERKECDKMVILENKKKEYCRVAESYKVVTHAEVPSLSYGPSEEVPCASSALQIGYNDTYGRHFAATRDINVGDIVLVEDQYCVSRPTDRSKEDELLHCCSHCQKLSFNLLPCPTCVWAMFCSEKCMIEAADQYHKLECPVICKLFLLDGELIQPGLIRCIVKVGLHNINKYFNFTDKTPEPNEDMRTRGFNSDGKYDSADFLTVINLEHNFSKHNVSEKLFFCVIALEMTKCFYPETYLQYHDLTILICHLISSFKSNVCGVSYSIFNCGDTELNNIAVGGAIYPAASLISHSCVPNLFPIFHGNKVVLYALCPIAKGEQVTLSYGPIWYKDDKDSRQIQLEGNYKFKCKCKACYYNWPSPSNLQPLTAFDFLKSPQTFSIIDKLNLFRKTAGAVVTTMTPLLLNQKSLDQYCKKRIKLVSDVIYVLYNNNVISNVDFAQLTVQLCHIFSVYGTVLTADE